MVRSSHASHKARQIARRWRISRRGGGDHGHNLGMSHHPDEGSAVVALVSGDQSVKNLFSALTPRPPS